MGGVCFLWLDSSGIGQGYKFASLVKLMLKDYVKSKVSSLFCMAVAVPRSHLVNWVRFPTNTLISGRITIVDSTPACEAELEKAWPTVHPHGKGA
jgi:hypothetical protein